MRSLRQNMLKSHSVNTRRSKGIPCFSTLRETDEFLVLYVLDHYRLKLIFTDSNRAVQLEMLSQYFIFLGILDRIRFAIMRVLEQLPQGLWLCIGIKCHDDSLRRVLYLRSRVYQIATHAFITQLSSYTVQTCDI